jgi:Xaa-Pro aminopeptidase
MFQNFDSASARDEGPARLALLRAELDRRDLAGFLVPRADAHMGENVAPGDERLAWLTGFTGSAGLCAALADRAALFVDGRYVLQGRDQTDPDAYEVVPIHETKPEEWLAAALPKGATLAYDPWLHGREEIDRIEATLKASGAALTPTENLVDLVWSGRPAPPMAKIRPHPEALAGEPAAEKRARIGADLAEADLDAAVLTLPDSIAWLLNIRGGDIARTPVAHAFAVIGPDGAVTLHVAEAKITDTVRAHLGNGVAIAPPAAFGATLDALAGRKVAVDKATAPVWVSDRLNAAGAEVVWRRDPCILPKARKNKAELAGARAAHLRDAAALARFLCWLDAAAPKGDLTEIDVVERLEAERAATGALRDIAFDTIAGAGPNGAIVHYRVNRRSNRRIAPGDILLVDSGGQYEDGTTDITRTMATGPVPDAARLAATLVLKGMIAISLARWPNGVSGRDLDALARQALWRRGFDYDHGTGHGVGAYLGVHEGPQGLSRRSNVALEPGMILSNEPGYYRKGAFGIRIENLLIVTEAAIPEGGDRALLGFATLTLAPIDRRLIDPTLLDAEDRAWLDAYHARVLTEVGPVLDAETQAWLAAACAPI